MTTNRKDQGMDSKSTSVTVGAFSFDTATGALTGPAAYMNSESYRLVISRIRAGQDPCGAFRFSPNPITALLVTIQTDYAGWHGLETFNALRGA